MQVLHHILPHFKKIEQPVQVAQQDPECFANETGEDWGVIHNNFRQISKKGGVK